MTYSTAQLCDQMTDASKLQIAEPLFRHFGSQIRFSGYITTLKVFEDGEPVAQALSEPGQGRVLVIDGGGSKRCALLGVSAAKTACANGWQGIVIYGGVRNSEELANLPIGILALTAHPLKSRKHGQGDKDVMITFAGVNFKKDHYLYADSDGMIVLEAKLD